ncbi:rhodanese-related sulfurtransferase [Pseudacidovorax intermedius]|uniref:Rhodanese-related sulfurtransferase n=1 Tax=Pseudacidovorax intermedius TaxID=433924 RepID=A0A370FC13_9BURK|nr:rhodanese-like domain-containing protein [Pseudacidovorax intermedius]RDI22776.1 rhodanese-related sulfurtransferase [Pseudacidovorax intermedius]
MTQTASLSPLPALSVAQVRQHLLDRREIALLDLREEDPYAQAHPLWAANLPLSRVELEAWRRIPRRDTLIVLYGEHEGEDLVPRGAAVLARLGYTNLHALEGGLEGWRRAGGELFRDVNVPSKSFGELVEHERHTPSLAAEEVKALLDAQADVVVLDARRFDEYQTMSIPGATSVPGAELVLRARALAPDAATRVIVNCAGRTRSIIGTQSLVNAGLPNPVAALRNGTIGWLLAGQQLEHGAQRRAPPDVDPAVREQARADAQAVAARAGVRTLALADLPALLGEAGRTTYRLDVRTPEEYEAGHLPGFASAPGGQLVQETDHHAPVRGARFVLADDDGVRAAMTGSWLAQMGWEVWRIEGAAPTDFSETGTPAPERPAPHRDVEPIAPAALAALLEAGDAVLIDVGASANYVRRHIPGAWFAVRAQLATALARSLPAASQYVLTCGTSLLAAHAAADLRALLDAQGRTDLPVRLLTGGNAAWFAAGLPEEAGEARLATPRTDRYRRPYEGTDAPREAMQGYLDWEFGLVAQLSRDGTHHFRVI